MSGQLPRVGLAMTTIGRPSLQAFLDSLDGSEQLPSMVAIADHTRNGDLKIERDHTFPVVIVPSTGGASRGRNDAVAALAGSCEIVGCPNDDSLYTPTTIRLAAEAFAAAPPDVAVVAGTFFCNDGPKFRLPPTGTILDRRTVWRAFEPAMFIRREVFERAGGFRDDMGTGAQTPWQSGDGTDMLLRIMSDGGRVLSGPDITVLGPDERKGLSADAYVAKHRAYARGTGFVYKTHDYPLHARIRVMIAPMVKITQHDPSLRLSARLAVARTLGRLEGLTGRRLPGSKDARWL